MTPYAEGVRQAASRLGDWQSLPFFTDELNAVTTALSAERADILPAADCVFAALERVGSDAVRAIILGQDPYPTPGHAHGLSFSVEPDVTPLPRSLGNIFKELTDDLGSAPQTGDLRRWADQGVLLLNSALTVRTGDAGSHAKIGWSSLTNQIIQRLAERDGLAWVLWGRHAQAFKPQIEAGSARNTLIIESAHPSPLSARRGFFGSKPFSRVNAHLAEHGIAPIDWTP